MSTAYIGLGSNLGDRWNTLHAAFRRLRAEPAVRVIATSECYETAPVDCPPGSGDYLNAVVAVETARPPHDLLKLLQQIERQFGRVRIETNSPRTLDLDLLLYDDLVINSPELVVPHPRMHERAFVLVPLSELSGSVGNEVLHPVLGKTAQEFLEPMLVNLKEEDPRPRLRRDAGGLARAPYSMRSRRGIGGGSDRADGASRSCNQNKIRPPALRQV